VLAFADDGNFQCEQYGTQENQENHVPENNMQNSNAPQDFNIPLRDVNQNAILQVSSAASQTVEDHNQTISFASQLKSKSPEA
jgi:type IV secretory pathway component VirB8